MTTIITILALATIAAIILVERYGIGVECEREGGASE
jgi:hypothetical protein